MSILNNVIAFLENLAHTTPLELFVLLGSFIEEVLAPIPSPLVMTLAGTLAKAQNYNVISLAFISLLGAIGKVFGAYILYFAADKMEDLVGGKIGKFLGISHSQIEAIGKKMTGHWKDNLFLIMARALPIIPSAPVSLACGVIKVNKKTFVITTFIGTYIRNVLYLYLGYAGFGNYQELTHGLDSLESIGQILIFGIILGIVLWAYYQRSKKKHHH